MNEHAIHPEMVCQGDGLVCPNCYGKLDGRSQIPVQNINGYPTRSYGGACSRPSCGLGFEVVQFQMNGKWYINHYQLYKTQPWGDKITVVPFPGQGETEPIQELKPESGQPKEIPVLIVGPGGDYRHTVEITGETPSRRSRR
jgi:hypothetical protein